MKLERQHEMEGENRKKKKGYLEYTTKQKEMKHFI